MPDRTHSEVMVLSAGTIQGCVMTVFPLVDQQETMRYPSPKRRVTAAMRAPSRSIVALQAMSRAKARWNELLILAWTFMTSSRRCWRRGLSSPTGSSFARPLVG